MPDPSGARLALVIPTYRWNDLARDTLTQAAAIGSEDVRVHIGDNSANPDKHAFLAALAARSTNVVVTCHPRNLGADPNWLFLIKAQTAPFICMAADDDSFSAAYYRSAVSLLSGDAACATASGLHVSVGRAGGKPKLSIQDERLEAEPLARIKNYRNENSICYAISRRPVIQGFAQLVEANPLPCPFYDYMLAFHLLSIGTYRCDARGFAYIYDHANWQSDDDFINSNKRWYGNYGLPPDFGYLTRLHWAVMAAHFFTSSFRSPELSRDDAEAIAGYLFARQRSDFARNLCQYRSVLKPLLARHPQAPAALERLMTVRVMRLAEVFDDFEAVVAAFAPEVAARHRAFQARTLLPGADAIALPPMAAAMSPRMMWVTATTGVRRLLLRGSGRADPAPDQARP